MNNLFLCTICYQIFEEEEDLIFHCKRLHDLTIVKMEEVKKIEMD